MDVVSDELVSSLEKLSSKDDNGGSSVTDFSVLDLGELNENLGGGMSDLKLLEDSGAIIGNGDITNVVNEHLIETLGSEGGLDDV